MTYSPRNGAELAAVLFDMDGTLVDTEPYWIAAEYDLVAEYGGTWTEADAHALVGNPLIVSADYIREHGGVPLPSEQIVDILLERVMIACARRTPWRAGVVELLAELVAASIPCAMVTMSYANLAAVVAAQLPSGTFRTLVTGDVVTRGKPHPESYLTAAARLGADPARCVAIEDSPTGLASAEDAGCVVIGVPNQVPLLPGLRRTLLPTLEGVDVAYLRTLVAASA